MFRRLGSDVHVGRIRGKSKSTSWNILRLQSVQEANGTIGEVEIGGVLAQRGSRPQKKTLCPAAVGANSWWGWEKEGENDSIT